MKKIGFIGVYDKTDMMLNLAKILTAMGKNVLVVDSTLNQKARYVVPNNNNKYLIGIFFLDLKYKI